MRLDVLVIAAPLQGGSAPLACCGPSAVRGAAGNTCALSFLVMFFYAVCCFCIADLQTSPKNVILGPGNSRELFSSVCISQDTGQRSHSDFTASEFTAYMV